MSKRLFLAYKLKKTPLKRGVLWRSYVPQLLRRYPATDHADFPLDAKAAGLLCFPLGLQLREIPSSPHSFTFVITLADGTEVYGAAFAFDEPIVGKEGRMFMCSKCICLLSHHRLQEGLKAYLNELFLISRKLSPIPLETYLGSLIYDASAPGWDVPIVQVPIGTNTVEFGKVRLLGGETFFGKEMSLKPLFDKLSPANIVTVFEHMLLEGKTILYSDDYSLLTPVAEALKSSLYPFEWLCVFAPILPLNLSRIVRCPSPFLVGLPRTFVDEFIIPDDVLLVDLDNDTIRLPNFEYPNPELPQLPEPLRSELQAELTSYAAHGHKSARQDNKEGESQARCAFLRALSRLMANYRKAFIVPAVLPRMIKSYQLFDETLFISSLPPKWQDFAKIFIETQTFSTFLLRRVIPSASEPVHSTLVFDWCVTTQNRTNLEGLKWEDLYHFVGLPCELYPRSGISGSVWPIAAPPHVYRVTLPDPEDIPHGPFQFATFPELLSSRYIQSQATREKRSRPVGDERAPDPYAAHSILHNRIARTISSVKTRMRELFSSPGSKPLSKSPRALVDKQISAVYELWFGLFEESEQEKRLNSAIDGCLNETSEKESIMKNLLAIYLQLDQMLRRETAPTHEIVKAVCLFALRHGLHSQFQTLYSLFAYALPHIKPDVIVALSRASEELNKRDDHGTSATGTAITDASGVTNTRTLPSELYIRAK